MEIKLPVLKPQELITILQKLGFRQTRKSKGGHRRFCHPDGRRTTVPFHKGKTIGKGLLRKILRDVDLTIDELNKMK